MTTAPTPRRMRQPRKALLRQQIIALVSENERLRVENDRLRIPWWRRLIRSRDAATQHSAEKARESEL